MNRNVKAADGSGKRGELNEWVDDARPAMAVHGRRGEGLLRPFETRGDLAIMDIWRLDPLVAWIESNSEVLPQEGVKDAKKGRTERAWSMGRSVMLTFISGWNISVGESQIHPMNWKAKAQRG
jgi:hypothetical protein